MKTFPRSALLAISLTMLAASLAEASTIRALDGAESDVAYPGGEEGGWLTGWKTEGRVEPEEVRPSFTHLMEGAVNGSPSLGDLTQHLIFRFSTPDRAEESAEQFNYAIGRRYDARHLTGTNVQTIRFLIRIDRLSGFSKSTDFVGAFGNVGRQDVQANTNPDTTWYVRMRADTKTWWVGRGDLGTENNWEDTSLPFEVGVTYEVVITQHQSSNTYDVKIGDDFEMKDIPCIRAVPTNSAAPMWIQFHAQADRLDDNGQLSIGGIQIAGE